PRMPSDSSSAMLSKYAYLRAALAEEPPPFLGSLAVSLSVGVCCGKSSEAPARCTATWGQRRVTRPRDALRKVGARTRRGDRRAVRQRGGSVADTLGNGAEHVL